jgi:ribosome-binding ATPase YchF (GTP1/OBG family)
VKNTDRTNQYLEHIRETHDPQLHLKTLEEELRGTMGKALGKQGEKILYNIQCMREERERYVELLETAGCTENKELLREIAMRHNHYRQKAKHARWELMVHRQAVGFIVNNHNFVVEKFPIGDPLPVENEDHEKDASSQEKTKQATNGKQQQQQQHFGDQLDWWQRIGRWK